ncbi:MAG TPA: IucA/IucC family protein, partial [Actinomycetota bacterium]|nr:IucA/IucC family protein [Actinomycetota bacterium]
ALRSGDDVRTPAEQQALTALRAAHPHLAAGFAPALRQARAVGLGKLWSALAREQLDGITVAAEEYHATLLLPDGTGVRGQRRLTELFAEHPPGLSVTRSGSGQAIDHPVALLDAVIRSRRGRVCSTEWRQLSDEIAGSVANHALALVGESWRRARLDDPGSSGALAWARRRSAAGMEFSPLAVFEQAVVDGHPLHPCARIRGGMTPEDLLAYAPEWADEVALGVVAVERSTYREVRLAAPGVSCLVQRWHPSAAGAASAHLRSIGRDPASYELLPVHPWQLRRTVPQRYEAALGDLRIVPIPRAAIAARPLLSLRTFAARADRRGPHWKTSVDVRLTTAVRIVSPEAARNGPVISGVVAEICRREEGFGGRFRALAELASGSYRPSADDPPGAAASLAAIARDSPERHVAAGEVALPAAALAARSPLTGRPLLADVLDELEPNEPKGRSLPDAAASFLEAYCACSLPPLLTLLSGWGVALEPHGENLVVVLCRGLPVRVLYRDFGGIRISSSRLARRGLAPPPMSGAVPTEDEDELRAKCLFPLLVTNLGQVVAALARVGACDAGRLWEIVGRRCRGAYAELKRETAIRAHAQRDEDALFGPTLPVKSMLRVQLSATPHVPQWVAVPNPLAEVPGRLR